MDTDLLREQQFRWERFRERAVAEVRHGYAPECALGCVYDRLLRIVSLPSFEDVVGWELFEVRCGDPVVSRSCLAQRTAWRQNEDLERFHAPEDRLTMLRRRFLRDMEPTLVTAEVTPDLGAVDAALACLMAVRVPLSVPMPSILGCDGSTYEMKLGHAWASVTLLWWEAAPAEWSVVGSVARQLLEHLEGLHEIGQSVADRPIGPPSTEGT